MYPDLPLWLSIVCVLVGFAVLAWSADTFVDGSSAVAKALGVSPFIIGMVVIGFGTSAPELCVSALSGATGHSDLSLGNAYGSCIFNIAVILGVAALIKPLVVKPSVVVVAVPALVMIALLSCLLVTLGNGFSRVDGAILLGVFAVLLPAYCWFDQSQKRKADTGGRLGEATLPVGRARSPSGPKCAVASARRPYQAPLPDDRDKPMPLWKAWLFLFVGLAFLVASSHTLVWGCVDLARTMGVSELLIGLTVVAMGTSLPELASAVASARKGEHEFVLGNIVGSNFFNTLAVVGLAGTISPFKDPSPYLLARDLPMMVLMSVSIAVFGFNVRAPREPKTVGRAAGAAWLLFFAVYMGLMLWQEVKLK